MEEICTTIDIESFSGYLAKQELNLYFTEVITMNNEKKAFGAILLGAGTMIGMVVAGKLIKKVIKRREVDKTEELYLEESE